jgi:hypothetical protein
MSHARVAPLDRRKGPRRTTADPVVTSLAPAAPIDQPQDRVPRGPDRRQSGSPAEGRLVGVLIPYMRAHSLSQRDLAALLGLSEADLLDLAWQAPERDPEAIDAIGRRYGANGDALAAIIAGRA